MKTFTSNNTEFFTHCNQKTAAAYLSNLYGLPKKHFLDFIQGTKKAGFIWDCMKLNDDTIHFSFFYNGRLAYFTINHN